MPSDKYIKKTLLLLQRLKTVWDEGWQMKKGDEPPLLSSLRFFSPSHFTSDSLVLKLSDISAAWSKLSLSSVPVSEHTTTLLSSFNWNIFLSFLPVVFSCHCSMSLSKKNDLYSFEGFLPDLFWLLNHDIVLEIIDLDHTGAFFSMHLFLCAIKLMTKPKCGTLSLIMVNI